MHNPSIRLDQVAADGQHGRRGAGHAQPQPTGGQQPRVGRKAGPLMHIGTREQPRGRRIAEAQRLREAGRLPPVARSAAQTADDSKPAVAFAAAAARRAPTLAAARQDESQARLGARPGGP
eukprot:2839693-Prymnesium_polylepis.1